MANIPIERAGTPWWVWLLGLLALIGLVWLLVSLLGDDDEVEDASVDPVETVAPAATFDLSDVYVTRVVGDNTFFVAPTVDGDDEMLVYLEEEATPGDPTEGRYDVTEGQNLSITGERMAVGDLDLSAWGLTPDQVALVGDEYVRATRLTVLGDEMANGDMEDGALGLADMTGDLSAYAGRMVNVDDVRVTALAGDSTFFVGDGSERTLVVLESLGESADGPGDGSDGAFDVNVGDVVSIDGEVMAFRRGMRGTTTLSDTDAASVEERRYVIVVNDRGAFEKQ